MVRVLSAARAAADGHGHGRRAVRVEWREGGAGTPLAVVVRRIERIGVRFDAEQARAFLLPRWRLDSHDILVLVAVPCAAVRMRAFQRMSSWEQRHVHQQNAPRERPWVEVEAEADKHP